jgi:steroid delta-isomerase-like uncharacterized protein
MSDRDSTDRMRQLIRKANEETFRSWNAHDARAVAAVFAEDAIVEDVITRELLRGREAIRARTASLFDAFPDLTMTRVMLLIDGTTNADQWVMRGTHRGPFLGITPTGRSFEIRGATYSEFDQSGLVIRDTNYVDVTSLLAQISPKGD